MGCRVTPTAHFYAHSGPFSPTLAPPQPLPQRYATMHINSQPLYIFDIDGTLCNIEHRLHFLEDKADPDRWDKFYKACVMDTPNHPVLAIMASLHTAGAEIWLFSGRSEAVRDETYDWLDKYTHLRRWRLRMKPEMLTMRPVGDYTEDHLLKQKWLYGMLRDDRERLVGIFDDRKRVVDMWRANGVPCFQVAEGEF